MNHNSQATGEQRAAVSSNRVVRQSDKPITLFPWEQREYARHYECWHNEKRQKEFLLAEINRIAKAINERDPVTAAELLDVIEDCTTTINSMSNRKLGDGR